MGRLKVLFLMLLTVSAVAVLSAGTLAAYNQTMELTGTIRAAQMVFNVSESGTKTQALGDCQLLPGGSKTYYIEIDTKDTEVGLDVELKVNSSGRDLPPGLSIIVDDKSIDPYGTGSASVESHMNGDSASHQVVPVVVSWNPTPEQLKAYECSQNFELDLSATVTAAQAA